MSNLDYNFWDDRTHELDINPCRGCEDYVDGKCTSNGGCADSGDINEALHDLNETLRVQIQKLEDYDAKKENKDGSK